MRYRLYNTPARVVVSFPTIKNQPKLLFMRKLFLFSLLAMLHVAVSSCEKLSVNGDMGSGSCDLPHTTAPAVLNGGWANGFTNSTQIIDAYNGNILGYTWSSAKYFSFTQDGKGAEFYYMAKGEYFQSATYAKGTIEFDEGATEQSGSFTFHACKAHYKGWGTSVVDRDATDEELHNSLTHRYYYEMQGNVLRIDPAGPVNDYSSSFNRVD